MLPYLKTSQVADQLGVEFHRVDALIRRRKIPSPAKDGSGHLIWLPADVERAKAALAAIRAKKRPAAE